MNREIRVLQTEQQQHRMRIQSLLFAQGRDVKVTASLTGELATLTCWDGQPLGGELRERIRRELQRLQMVEQQLKQLRQEQAARLKQQQTPALEKVRLLEKLCGLARTSSWIFVMELFGWRKFDNRRQLAGALGLDADAVSEWR